MSLALLSDIHGNLPALEKVLGEVARRGVTAIANLGDSLSGPLCSRETADFLMRQGWPQLAGNPERQPLTIPPVAQKPSDRFAYERREPRVRAWMEGLPRTATLEGGVLLCHGTPLTDCEYFLETVEAAGLRQATDGEIAARRGAGPWRGIPCATRTCRASSGGTTGPCTSTRGASACRRSGTTTTSRTSWRPARPGRGTRSSRSTALARRPTLIAVPYDHASCAALARENGRPDWEHALLAGTALPV